MVNQELESSFHMQKIYPHREVSTDVFLLGLSRLTCFVPLQSDLDPQSLRGLEAGISIISNFSSDTRQSYEGVLG